MNSKMSLNVVKKPLLILSFLFIGALPAFAKKAPVSKTTFQGSISDSSFLEGSYGISEIDLYLNDAAEFASLSSTLDELNAAQNYYTKPNQDNFNQRVQELTKKEVASARSSIKAIYANGKQLGKPLPTAKAAKFLSKLKSASRALLSLFPVPVK